MPYSVTFERVGRHRDVPALHSTAPTVEALMDEIFDHIRGRLGSREVEIYCKDIDLDHDTVPVQGHILVGGARNGGSFTITPAQAVS